MELSESGLPVAAVYDANSISNFEPYEPLRVDPRIEHAQAGQLRRNRDQAAVRRHPGALRAAAEGAGNVLPLIKDALRAGAALGGICAALRAIWGVCRPPDVP